MATPAYLPLNIGLFYALWVLPFLLFNKMDSWYDWGRGSEKCSALTLLLFQLFTGRHQAGLWDNQCALATKAQSIPPPGG